MNPFTKGKVASRTGNAVISEGDVRQIRKLAASHTTRDLAEIYGVGVETIRKILRRDSWKWVADKIDFEAPTGPMTQADKEAAAASEARLLRLLERPVEPTGLDKLQLLAAKEREKVTKVDTLLNEIQPRNPLDE
jgi:hypothetical protein